MSLFDRVAGLQDATQVFSCGTCEISKNTYFEEHQQMTASEICFFTWTAIFNNLHFWLKLLSML